MIISIKSRPDLKLSHIGSKTRSLGQIMERPCVHSGGHNYDQKFIKMCQNVKSHKHGSG